MGEEKDKKTTKINDWMIRIAFAEAGESDLGFKVTGAEIDRKTKLACCQRMLGVAGYDATTERTRRPWQDLVLELTGIDPSLCPSCGEGHMRTTKMLVSSAERAPPETWRRSA